MKKQILVILILLCSISSINAQWVGTTAYSPIYGRFDSTLPYGGLGYYSLKTNHGDGYNGGITIQYLSNGTLKDGLSINQWGHVISNGPFFGKISSESNPILGFYSLKANKTNETNGGLTIQRLKNGNFIDALIFNGNGQIISNGSFIGRFDTQYPSVGLGYYAFNTNNANDRNGGLTVQYLSEGNLVDGFILNHQGNIGIGTNPNSSYKLNVNGTIHAREVLIDNDNWSDFVFEKAYQLPTINEVDNFIQTNGHLPNIPSAQEVKEKGTNVAEIQSKLLQKIEELTLYVIEQNKKIEQLEKQVYNK